MRRPHLTMVEMCNEAVSANLGRKHTSGYVNHLVLDLIAEFIFIKGKNYGWVN